MGLSDNNEMESGGFGYHSDVEGIKSRVQLKIFIRFVIWEESETIFHREVHQLLLL